MLTKRELIANFGFLIWMVSFSYLASIPSGTARAGNARNTKYILIPDQAIIQSELEVQRSIANGTVDDQTLRHWAEENVAGRIETILRNRGLEAEIITVTSD